ncbi:MAG: hypothetical protein QNJ90_08905 [Planctomycetota bacterium]|nr:hypothetical protein [Planctomycetota bacterium]
MSSQHGQARRRLVCLSLLGVLLLLPAACGTGYDGGGRVLVQLTGGAIRPSRIAYEASPAAAAELPGGVDAQDLPERVDLRLDGVIPPVKNQVWNSCVGWSLGYYLISAIEARRLRSIGLFLDMEDPENWFAPDFLYGQRDTVERRTELVAARAASGDPIAQGVCLEDDGEIGCMRPERALAALMEFGCCRWTWLCQDEGGEAYRPCLDEVRLDPARGSRSPWQFATEGSGDFRPRCFVRFGAIDDLAQGTVQRMQAWLHREGTPIAIVVNMTSGWVEFAGENATEVELQDKCGRTFTERRSICLDAGGIDLGSQHMMTIIGYDRSFPSREQYARQVEGCEGSFLVINQWGEKWGDRGTMWIPCAELADIWVGGYGILPGKDLVVRGAGSQPLRDFVCVQDDEGKYLNVSADGNDVPVNLLTACEILDLDDERRARAASEPCGDLLTPDERAMWEAACAAEAPVPQLFSRVTACRVAFPPRGDPTGLTIGPAAVNGRDASTGDLFDSADWYVLEVPETVAAPLALEVRLQPRAPATSVPADIGVRITDPDYADIGAALAAGDGATAPVGPGPTRVFVKVFTTRADEPSADTPGFPYDLVLRALPLASSASSATALTAPCRSGTPVAVSLGPIGGASSRERFLLSGVPAGHEVRVVVSGVAGAEAQVQVTAAVEQVFRFGTEFVGIGDCLILPSERPSESWLRSVQSTRAGTAGASLRVPLSEDLGRGVYLGGRNSRGLSFDTPDFTVPEETDFDVVVDARNLASADVAFDLHVEICGPDADAVAGLGPAPPPTADRPRFLLRGEWEWQTYRRRHLEVQLDGYCGEPEVVLLDDDDDELTAADGFELATVRDGGGVLAQRITVPESYDGNVWFRVVERAAAGRAPEAFALDVQRMASLAAWPLVQQVDAPRDGNGTPSRAVELALSEVSGGTVRGSVAYADWQDFFRLSNDTGSAQRVAVELRRESGSADCFDPIIFGSHWLATRPGDPGSTVDSFFFCAPCGVAFARTGDPTVDRIEFDLEPGQAQMLEIQFWEIGLQFIQFDPADYRLDVSSSPR